MGLAASVAAPRINQYERGSAEPSVEDLQRLAEALGVPAAALVTDDPALHRLLIAWADASSTARAEAIRRLEAEAERGNRPGLRTTQKRVRDSLSALAAKRACVDESETGSPIAKKRARKNSS
jgi:transcriptional regulator with XRE-family HTH domain